MIGAFLGAAAVYFIYRDGLVAAGMPNVWSTGPGSIFGQTWFGAESSGATGSYSMITAIIAELFGTFVLIWGIAASGDMKNMGLKDNFGPFIVGFAVLAVGLSSAVLLAIPSILLVTLVPASLVLSLEPKACSMDFTG